MSEEYQDEHIGEGDGKSEGTVGQQLAAAIKLRKGGFASTRKDLKGSSEADVKKEGSVAVESAADRYRRMYNKPLHPPPKKKATVEKLIDTAKKIITKGII